MKFSGSDEEGIFWCISLEVEISFGPDLREGSEVGDTTKGGREERSDRGGLSHRTVSGKRVAAVRSENKRNLHRISVPLGRIKVCAVVPCPASSTSRFLSYRLISASL